jgi:phytoene desaturase (3,4-didehydrolycopene-forming)
VELLKCEPNYNLWFGDGESFELSTDTARMKQEVEKWEGIDGFERYLGFLQESHRHYEHSITHVLRKNFTNLLQMARPSFLRYLFALHPFESIYYRASQYFYTERLRRVFTFGSMYMGMSPFDAPGTYSLLQYTELAEGIWYPRGGFHVVLDALVKVGKRMGVEYRLSTGVSRINVSSDGKRAEGVTLSSGEELSADLVVVNADLVYAYNNLLPSSSKAASLSKKSASCSSISFYWAMDKQIPELTAHNIFLADDYKESFDDIFKRQLIPQEPSFYVNVPSHVDPSAAPDGKDTVVVLVPVGHLLENHATNGLDPQSKQDWNAMVNKAREKVLTTIEGRTGAKMRHSIIHEEINTPGTWKEKFNLDKGAILGLSHSFFNVLSFRPNTKHAKYQDLYFVGASTHPGTGVPICLAGSKITAEQILDDRRLGVPWTRNGEQGAKGKGGKVEVKDIDRIQSGPSTLSMLLVALFLTLILYWTMMR